MSEKSYVGMMVCARCGEPIGVLLDKRLKNTFSAGENYSDGSLCDECQEEHDKIKKALDEGGIAWKCDTCDTCGVLIYAEDTAELIDHFREVNNLKIGDKHGILFKMCPECEPEGRFQMWKREE